MRYVFYHKLKGKCYFRIYLVFPLFQTQLPWSFILNDPSYFTTISYSITLGHFSDEFTFLIFAYNYFFKYVSLNFIFSVSKVFCFFFAHNYFFLGQDAITFLNFRRVYNTITLGKFLPVSDVLNFLTFFERNCLSYFVRTQLLFEINFFIFFSHSIIVANFVLICHAFNFTTLTLVRTQLLSYFFRTQLLFLLFSDSNTFPTLFGRKYVKTFFARNYFYNIFWVQLLTYFFRTRLLVNTFFGGKYFFRHFFVRKFIWNIVRA